MDAFIVGIDVSKDRLDVHVAPSGEAFAVSNDHAGIEELAARLRPLAPRAVALEATGGFESLAVATLTGSGLPVMVVNPAQVRAFANALGKRAKTDPIDAGVIAAFVVATGAELRPLPHLRGAVFSQRRVYADVDGPTFLGPGPVGAPISQAALESLAEAGANLAVWSGPGPLGEGGAHAPDAAIEDHIADWLDRCRAAGLYTVLAFRSGPGRRECSVELRSGRLLIPWRCQELIECARSRS
jgi:hypothetical protein